MLSELFDRVDVDGRNFKVRLMILREYELREFEKLERFREDVFSEVEKEKGLATFLIKQHPKMHLHKLHEDAFPYYLFT